MRNKTATVVVLSLCLLVPAAVKFSFSLVLIVDIMYLMIAITGIQMLIAAFLRGPLARLAELCFTVLAAALFSCALNAFSPILGELLSLYILLASVSAYLLLYPDDESSIESVPVILAFRNAFSKGLQFCMYILLFGFFRELLGMGCISLPVSTGLRYIPVFSFWGHDLFRFAASTGGALILIGLIIALGRFVRQQTEIARRIQK